MNIGNRIKNLRIKQGMSQTQFADKFNVTRQTVSNWENNKNYPDLDILEQISQEFNVSFDELLKEESGLAEKTPKRIPKKIWLLLVICVIALVEGSNYVYERNLEPLADHLGPLTYELPEAGYVHTKEDVITKREELSNKELIRGKVYRNEENNTEVTIYEYDQWDEFMTMVQKEKETNKDLDEYGALSRYEKTPPDFVKHITVFSGEDFVEGTRYTHYYKCYVRTQMKVEQRDYIIMVRGGFPEGARFIAEAFIDSMDYNSDLKDEYS